MSNILLIGDMVGYGNLGMSAMIPILSKMKYEILRLPSSLVSNNFCYERFAVMDTTDYMRQCIEIWEQEAFHIDAVSTGFLVSEEQTRIVADYCRKLKSRGAKIFVDPIMADDGKLYNGVTTKTVEYMRSMCKVADVIVPNMTEATFLAGRYEGKTSLTREEADELIMLLHYMGDNSVVISSMVMDGTTCTMLYDAQTAKMSILPYQLIPVQFSGTGDMFSSILIGHFLHGASLEDSVLKAMNFVSHMIEVNKNYPTPDNGIPIERYLDDIIL
ncbi:MAG: bifunctional hydroxymethylpyrimidine kinase/phosphomethylpyrimidine kinase [Bacteroidales bacterium]|nr:bifunctional hydroxymethylpyrimidine kinase/phosphomethylpyrimidine kinase [Bacteroidales bacterium]